MPIPRDYRDMKNPRLTMSQVLSYVISMGQGSGFTSKDIAKKYKFSLAEAGTRLNTLRRYGLIRRISKKRPFLYEVTKWGYKFHGDNNTVG